MHRFASARPGGRPAAGASGEREPARPPGGRGRTAPTGREAECAAFDTALEAVLRGGRELVEISGDPGIGKSRLLDALAGRAAARGLAVLTGRAHAYAGTPLGLFAEPAAAALRRAEDGGRPVDARDRELLAAVASGRGGPRSADRPVPARTTAPPAADGPAAPAPASVGRTDTARTTGPGPRPTAADPRRPQPSGTDPCRDLPGALVRVLTSAVHRAGSAPSAGIALFLDDVHWADTPSVHLLHHLLHQPWPVPFLLVYTVRPRQAAAQVLACPAAAAGSWRTSHLSVGPLPEACLDDVVGGQLPAGRRRLLYEGSGGNPLYAQALSGLGDDELRAVDHAVPASDRIPAAVRSRLTHELLGLTPLQLDVMQAAAVLSPPFGADLLAHVAGCAPAAALAALDALVAHDLLRPGGHRPDDLRLRHPALRPLLRSGMPPGRLVLLHERAAAALAGSGADPYLLAPHLAWSARPGDVRAARALAVAAGTAVETIPAVAAGWLERAAYLLPDAGPAARDDGRPGTGLRDDVHDALLLARARAGLRAAAPDGPPRTPERGPAPGPLRAAAVALQAAHARRDGDLAAARAFLDAVPAARRGPAPAGILLERAAVALCEGDHERARTAAREVLAARGADGWRTAADMSALATLALADAAADDGDGCARHAAQAAAAADALPDGELADHLDAVQRAGWANVLSGRYAAARRLFQGALDLAHRTGQDRERPGAALGLACVAVAAGRLEEAVLQAEDCVAVRTVRRTAPAPSGHRSAEAGTGGPDVVGGFDPAGGPVAGGGAADATASSAAVVRAWALLWRVGPQAALPAARQVLRDCPEGPARRAAAGVVAAAALTSTDALPAQGEPPYGIGESGTVLQAVAAAACAATGVPVLVHPAGPADPDPARLVTEASRAAGPAEAAEQLARAADVFDAAGLSPTACWLRLIAARGMVRHGGRDATLLVGLVKEAAAAVGADHLRHAAADLQRAVAARGPRSRPQEQLSLREADIVRLVCRGMSNRDIAALLFISAKTVEAHLTRIFRKAGVRSRSALVATMAAQLPTGG